MALATHPPRGDATRLALILTAIDIFGREGFHAASTRAIADAAGVNQALIGYHFGNKDGLYLAAFGHIADSVQAKVGPKAASIRDAVQTAEVPQTAEQRRALYLPLLFSLTDAFVSLMTSDESAHWARLIIREQQAPSPAFAVLYDRVMEPILQSMTALVSRLDPMHVAGDPKLVVATIMGQVIVFRMAHAALTRLMDWPVIGDDEAAAIKAQVHRNVRALLTLPEAVQ